jgi:hypothetical protein
MLHIFSTSVIIRQLWQLKTAIFLHRCLICDLLLHKGTKKGQAQFSSNDDCLWLLFTQSYRIIASYRSWYTRSQILLHKISFQWIDLALLGKRTRNYVVRVSLLQKVWLGYSYVKDWHKFEQRSFGLKSQRHQ